MHEQFYLAVDIGASSGRHVVGCFDGQRLRLEEVHRFANGPVNVLGSLHWDMLALWQHVQDGMARACERFGDRFQSVGVATWGVDFGLVGRGDTLLGNPYHYRDRQTDGILQRAFSIASREEIFAATGLQFMQFNTLYQLLAMRMARSPILEAADSLLMMPDLFHWLMTGVKANEFTNATTTQFYDPLHRRWAVELLAKFDLPTRILGDVVEPGTRLGPLVHDVAASTGLSHAAVVAPATHDTASAVLAVPARSGGAKPDWCYISSGTWSLLGVELAQAVVNDDCLRLNFTNEGGAGHTTRLLKNIAGLWLVQECRRVWSRGGRDYSWDQLEQMAMAAAPRASLINPDDHVFLAPADMAREIAEFCRRTGQTVLESEGAIVRCALESLALRYRRVLEWLEELSDSRIATIHIVGGGAQNRSLCQWTADACGRPVVAGPIEATATGNLAMQAISAGSIASVAEAREVIRTSFDVETYEPRAMDEWDEAYQCFLKLCDG